MELAKASGLPPKILLVDDEDFVLSLSTSALRSLGFQDIDNANNGVEALERLNTSERSYDIIICDLNMPEMDGVEFMRRIKADKFSGGLILLSGEDERILKIVEELATVQNINIIGRISKPVTTQGLKEIIENYHLDERITAHTPGVSHNTVNELTADLKGNLDQLRLHYQPFVHIASGEIRGIETLISWQYSDGEVLNADELLKEADKCGCLSRVVQHIYQNAARQSAVWSSQRLFLQNVIRLPIVVLDCDDLKTFFLNRTENVNQFRRQLILEFPEHPLAEHWSDRLDILNQIQLQKIGIAIGNLGESGLKLGQINDFPLSLLRIDLPQLTGESQNNEILATVRSGRNFGRHLRPEVVLKGVEKREDWEIAESVGAHYAQGAFCSQPLPGKSVSGFIESWIPPRRQNNRQVRPALAIASPI